MATKTIREILGERKMKKKTKKRVVQMALAYLRNSLLYPSDGAGIDRVEA
jgi:hypothetical protein